MPPGGLFPYPLAHTNWRDEQRAWSTTATLFNQSWHMTDLYVSGPDALRLLSETSVNSYENFGPGRAKQFLAVNVQGHVIGDGILFALAEGEYAVVGEKPAINWLQYQAETGGYAVTLKRDNGLTATGIVGATPKRFYRYELEGPNAQKILEQAAGTKLEPIKFFRMADIEIAGHTVHALSHTMAAAPGAENTGLELFGPEEHHQAFLDAILAAGEDFGMKRGGAIAYFSTLAESGWIPAPLPAIFGADMTAYRQWLPDDTIENFFGSFGLRGSYHPGNLEGYYMTPWALGYGHMIKFDHDFIGRDALERMADEPRRTKVWLEWNRDDTERVLVDSELDRPDRPRLLPTPAAVELYDEVFDGDEAVGLTHVHGYTVNLGGWVSIASIDESRAVDGTELAILWGDHEGGKVNPFVPDHTQTRIRATVHTKSPATR